MKRLFRGKKSKEPQPPVQRPGSWSSGSYSAHSSRDDPLPVPPPTMGMAHHPDLDRGPPPEQESHYAHDHPDDRSIPETTEEHAPSLVQNPPAPMMMQAPPPAQKAPKRRWFSFKPPPGAPVPRTDSSSSTSSLYGGHTISRGHIKPPSVSHGGEPESGRSHLESTRGYSSMDTTRPPDLSSMASKADKPKKKRLGLFNIRWGPKKSQLPLSPLQEEYSHSPTHMAPIPLARSASEPSRPGTIEPESARDAPWPVMDDVVPLARSGSQITRQSLLSQTMRPPAGMEPPPAATQRKSSLKRPAGITRFFSLKKKRPPSPIPESQTLARPPSLPPSQAGTLDPDEPVDDSFGRRPSTSSRISRAEQSENRTIMEYPAQRGASLRRTNTRPSVHPRTGTSTPQQTGNLSRRPTVDRQRSAPPPPASPPQLEPPQQSLAPPPSQTPRHRDRAIPSAKDKFRLWHHANQPLIAHPCRALLDPPIGDFIESLCTGRKRAVCIGINYIDTKYPLKGCINDAEHAREYLIRYLGFRSSNIAVLTDTGKNKPTRAMLMGAFKWLVEGAQPHDSLFLHYSGHGGQAPDPHGDEEDGWDEVIYPLDYKENGYIDDDTLYKMVVEPLPAGCRLTGVFDACHSGTVLDLPYIYSSSCRQRSSHVSNRSRKRAFTGADVLSLSGCKDGETSADTFVGGVAVGAMSWAFLSTLKRHKDLTYKELLSHLRTVLEDRYQQRPQLGSSHPIDPNRKFVI